MRNRYKGKLASVCRYSTMGTVAQQELRTAVMAGVIKLNKSMPTKIDFL